VAEFHAAAGAPIRQTPTIPPRKEADARVNMAFEEYDEHEREVADYQEDVRLQNAGPTRERDHIAKVGRELGDAVYVAYGTALEYGVDLDAIIAEIHAANMRKVRGGVKKRKDGKVLKPDGWEPPDVYRVIFG